MALIMTSAAGSIPYMDRRISDGTHLLSDAKDLVHQLRKEWRLDEISSKVDQYPDSFLCLFRYLFSIQLHAKISKTGKRFAAPMN